MKLGDVRDALYDGLARCLPGWKLSKKDEGFVRQTPWGRQRILVPIWNYRPEYLFSFVLTTRLDAAEEIFNLYSGVAAHLQAQTPTTMTQLSYFFDGAAQTKRFSVTTERDISDAIDSLAPLLSSRILPFLDTHRDATSIDAGLNGDDKGFDTSDLASRGLHAVIVAHLANNPRFEDIVQAHRLAFEKMDVRAREGFAAVVKHLRDQRA
jgi:hypothetical protein